jgi:hypothetical protein
MNERSNQEGLTDKQVYELFDNLYNLKPADDYVGFLYELGEGIHKLVKEAQRRLGLAEKQNGDAGISYLSSMIRGLIYLENKVIEILGTSRKLGDTSFEDLYNGFTTQKKMLDRLYHELSEGRIPENFYFLIIGSAEYSEELYKRAGNLRQRLKQDQNTRYTNLAIISIFLSLGFLSYLFLNKNTTAMAVYPSFSTASIFLSLFLLLLSSFLLIRHKLKKH